MKLSDLVIIYFACGSPFGVYQITKNPKTASALDWCRVALSFLFWPVVLTSLLVKRLASDVGAEDTIHHSRVELIRSKIEHLAFSDRTSAALFEFREVFYRYAGLVEASSTEETAGPVAGIFEISGHRNAALASRCLARRNRERLSFHKARTRNEFVDLISTLGDDEPDGRAEILDLALELTRVLGDSSAFEDLSSILPGAASHRTQPPNKPDKVWHAARSVGSDR